MTIKLYYFAPSAPSRSALLAVRAIGIPVDVITVDLFKKEQLSESFIKVNPQHCLPTLDDGGFIIWESKAIAAYLADKYGKNDALYPKDLKERALVNQLLYFDSSNLYVKIRAICLPILFKGVKEISQTARDDFNGALSFLDESLSGRKWVASDDHYTIADLAILASLSGMMAFGWDMSSYQNIQRWRKNCVIIPGYEENLDGAKQFGEAVRKNLEN